MSTTNICIWGDSITYGAWDREGGWAESLRRFLHGRTLTSNFREYYWIYNLGIPGDTTRDILERFDVECEMREPDVIIFAVGINDSSYEAAGGNAVPLEEFNRNIAVLCEKAKGLSAKIVFVGLTAVDEDTLKITDGEDRPDAFYSNEEIKKYDDALKAAADGAGAVFLDMRNLIKKDDLIDGLHPDTEGHRKMFEVVKGVFVPSPLKRGGVKN